MLPTFFGLNSVTRALLAQQEAVDVVNQNISNVNTPGYSLQEAELQATSPYTATAFNRPSLAGQLGTGAYVPQIKRFQDELLNSQIRFANQSVGQLQTANDLYTQIQAIYNDPSNVAVNTAATNFFNSIHDLTNTPESDASRQLVQQDGSTLTNAISTRFAQLTTLQSDLNTKVVSIVGDINTTIKQIAQLNNSIAEATGVGDNANDLEDQRDALVDHLSSLVDVRDVKNPDGTDTIQMNGRFLVNKDQAYTLTTLTNASSTALIKPVQVFWQEDVTKYENAHVGFDPITGKSLTTNVAAVGAPSPVAQALVSTGSLYGALSIRDQVIQNTLLPQLNELSDSLTNTQVLSLSTGLTANTHLLGSQASPDDFTVTVITPQGTASPPGAGQRVTATVGAAAAALANAAGGASASVTVQNVIDAINSSAVAPYVHASLNAAGQLQIDTITAGALVKVDQANGAASKDFGFSAAVADGFNLVHVQGYGLNTPPQWTGGIGGLTLATSMSSGDTLNITGPDGTVVNVVVPPPVTTVFPAPTTTTVQALLDTINAKGLSHGFQAALDASGHLTVFSSPTIYGADGHLVGTPAQITSGTITAALTPSTSIYTAAGADKITVTGPGGVFSYTAVSGDTVQTLLDKINTASIGVTASINSVGQFQLTTQNTGSKQSITLSNVSGAMSTTLGLANGTISGLDHGYPPSSTVTVAVAGTVAVQDQTIQDFAGGTTSGGTVFPSPTTFANTNQFFFDGSQQQLTGTVVPATSIAAGGSLTFNQVTSPSQLTVAAFPSSPGVAATFPVTVTITGTDAATGTAGTVDTITFTAAGAKVQGTPHVFSSIASIASTAAANTSVQIYMATPGTQYDTANSVVVDANVVANPSAIAASSVPGLAGNDINALALLNIQQQAVVTDGQTAATIGDFYSNITESLGGAAQQVNTNMTSQQQLVQHLTNQKQSVVGVNLDEEAAKLVALQHAYQAAARAITTQDSMLDTIINGMGLVGRA